MPCPDGKEKYRGGDNGRCSGGFVTRLPSAVNEVHTPGDLPARSLLLAETQSSATTMLGLAPIIIGTDTGSDVFIRALREEGVDVLFGHPGGAVLFLYDAIHRHAGRLPRGGRAPRTVCELE